MAQPLPPLAAIRVFEAVARKLSFTRAAEELGMTQSAVSYQIKLLEERLGTPLFLRRSREIVLTDTGQRLAPYTTEAFNLLRETYGRFEDRRQETLNINTTHAFATLWLAPRLGSFQHAHPNVGVRIETTSRVVDFEQEEVDVVVRAGEGNWPGLIAVKVLNVRYAPMLSPQLAASVGGIHEPPDIIKLPLLDPKNNWWTSWLRAHDLPLDVLERQRTPSLGMQVTDASAALDGQGVALLTPAYYRRELADGRLVQPFAKTFKEIWAYWLAYPESRRRLRRIRAFREWILAEASKELDPEV